MPKMTIGEFLSLQRKAKGLTQQEVADMLGISNKTLSSWESGRSYPDILTLPALAELYGVTVDEILNGVRAEGGRNAGEVSEASRKKLLRQAENRYSVKCTTLTAVGIGGVGLLALALCLQFVAAWLLVLFSVLFVLTELAVVILFTVFEKSALTMDEEASRYSLAVKRLTFRAAFKIICTVCIFAVCASFFLQFVLLGNATATVIVILATTLVLLLLAVTLLWLSRRGRECCTEEEAAAAARNKTLAIRIFSVGGAIAIALCAATSVLSSVTFASTQRQLGLPKEEFLRAIQTVNISAEDAALYGIETDAETGDYFVDIEAALKAPAPSLSEQHRAAYSIEGDLYFRYAEDGGEYVCYISYIPDPSSPFEKTVCAGTVWFRDRAQFDAEFPTPSAQNLLIGMEEDEVFFVLNPAYFDNITVFHWSGHRYRAERRVEVSGGQYALLTQVTQNYPFLAVVGFAGETAVAAVCIFLYCKKRMKL